MAASEPITLQEMECPLNEGSRPKLQPPQGRQLTAARPVNLGRRRDPRTRHRVGRPDRYSPQPTARLSPLPPSRRYLLDRRRLPTTHPRQGSTRRRHRHGNPAVLVRHRGPTQKLHRPHLLLHHRRLSRPHKSATTTGRQTTSHSDQLRRVLPRRHHRRYRPNARTSPLPTLGHGRAAARNRQQPRRSRTRPRQTPPPRRKSRRTTVRQPHHRLRPRHPPQRRHLDNHSPNPDNKLTGTRGLTASNRGRVRSIPPAATNKLGCLATRRDRTLRPRHLPDPVATAEAESRTTNW